MRQIILFRDRLAGLTSRSGGDSFTVKLLLTLAVALFVVWRQPDLLLTPRFWAEEGTNYFAYAYSHTWLENLLYPQFGYYTLYNSIATSLAATLPLTYAPYVTTYLAFIVQVAVSAAVIWWRIPILDSLFKKAVVAFGIQFLAYARIWLTTLGVQYFLCVLTFLILLSETGSARKFPSVLRQGILAFNGLTGVLSCFLIPAFFMKWRKERSQELLRYCLILSACLLVHAGVFATSFLHADGGVSSRLLFSNPLTMFARFFYFQFVIPFTGYKIWNYGEVKTWDAWLTGVLHPLIGDRIYAYNYMIIAQLLGAAIFIFIVFMALKLRKRAETQIMVAAFLIVTLFSNILSVNTSSGPRYTYAPSVMILIFLVGITGWKQIAAQLRTIAVTLVLLAVLMNDYRETMVFSYDSSWPTWRQELVSWQNNQEYAIRIWPPPFAMRLQRR